MIRDAEHRFVELAQKHIVRLPALLSDFDYTAELIRLLEDISGAAREVQARAITLAAGSFLSYLKQPKSSISADHLEHHYHILQNLIGQYVTGYQDLQTQLEAIRPYSEPDAIDSELGRRSALIDKSAVSNLLFESDEMTAGPSHQESARILTELLPHAPEKWRASLQGLINYRAAENSKPPAQEHLESVITKIADQALGLAHCEGREISLSYQADDIFISHIQADWIEKQLGRALSAIVKRALRHRPRGGQISITAHEHQAGIKFHLSDNGRPINIGDLDLLGECKLTMEHSEKGNNSKASGNMITLLVPSDDDLAMISEFQEPQNVTETNRFRREALFDSSSVQSGGM